MKRTGEKRIEGRRGGEGDKGERPCGRERGKGGEKRVRQWTLSALHFLSLPG